MSEEPEHRRGLNPEQYRGVTAIDGPVLVLAGAGSGKTRVLTRRIAELVASGASPESILAVTFTNKAAAEMKQRVVELVGEAADRLWVSTFHSTCCRILRVDIEPLGFTRRFAIYDDEDQLRLLKQILDASGRDKALAKEIASRIDHHKNHMETPDDVVRAHRSHVNDPVIVVWREYEEALRAADALDFNDLIGRTVELFQKRPDVLARWRERFRYVLVDEYQDTNRGQYLLLRLLADEHRNLCVVGDDDQSIYGFRGADVSNILNFEKDFPESVVVRLEQNYRSTGHILTLANAVVEKNTERLTKKLWTEAEAGARVKLHLATDPRAEAKWVARALLSLRRRGSSWGDIAIVYRTNATARFFEQELRTVRVPYRVVGGRSFYERREVRDVLAYLRLVVNPSDDAAYMRVVNVPARGVGAKTLAALRDDAATKGLPLLRASRSSGSPRSAGEKGVRAFADLVAELAELAREVSPPRLVEEVLTRSGYRAMLDADRAGSGERDQDASDRLDNLEALVRDAAQTEEPFEGSTPMDRLRAYIDRVSLSAGTDELPEGGCVTLLTVHSAKGLEYPVVLVVQMNEGVFPHARSSGDKEVDEERRLCYVAFTRAMRQLIVTRSAEGPDGHPASPSRFLLGVPAEVLDGDLPETEPGSTFEPDEPDRRSKLRTFMQAHLERRGSGSTPSRRIEIEDPEQLVPGVSVHHPKIGLATVRRVDGGRVEVVLASGRATWIRLDAIPLHLVVD